MLWEATSYDSGKTSACLFVFFNCDLTISNAEKIFIYLRYNYSVQFIEL